MSARFCVSLCFSVFQTIYVPVSTKARIYVCPTPPSVYSRLFRCLFLLVSIFISALLFVSRSTLIFAPAFLFRVYTHIFLSALLNFFFLSEVSFCICCCLRPSHFKHPSLPEPSLFVLTTFCCHASFWVAMFSMISNDNVLNRAEQPPKRNLLFIIHLLFYSNVVLVVLAAIIVPLQ